jgi:hypothetical protein
MFATRLPQPSCSREALMPSATALPSSARALPRTGRPDPLSLRAMARVAALPPHERLLLLSGCSLRELARQLGVVHTRLSAVFSDATAFGRLSSEWRDRLAGAVGATPDEIDALFGISRPGAPAPRTRRALTPGARRPRESAT